MQEVVGDFAGPFSMTNPINKRSTCKYWLLVTICDYSRYISITIVENLSTEAIMRSFQQLKYKFGATQIIRSDMGSNFTGARNRLLDDEEIIDDDVRRQVTQTAKKHGLQIIARVARAPWIQGSCEKAIHTIKRCWPTRKLHYAEMQFICEMVENHVNRRPLGLSRSGAQICPLDLRPLRRPVTAENNSRSLLSMSDRLRKTEEEFKEAWEQLYSLSIISLKKWNKDFRVPQVGDLIQISDISGRPQLGLVESIRSDTANQGRYFNISYVSKDGKRKHLERTAQSLCLLLSKEELENEIIRDPIDFLTEGQVQNMRKTKKLKVNVQQKGQEKIIDI